MKTIISFRSKLFALILALVASVSSFAYDFVFANDFHIDGFGYKIISNDEPHAVVLMEIADCTEDVVIPATVTYNGLQYIVSTVGMGGSIITNDARITIKSIFIPKTIQVVNMRALSDCPHLCSIVVDEENPYLDSRNDCNAIVTSKDLGSPANTLIVGCQMTTIPNSVTEIGDYAFYRCDSLKHMTVPNGVTTINNGAFSNCSSLTSIRLPESLTEMSERWIFDGCKNLKEVFFFAKTPPYIAYGMFSGLNPTIYVPAESLNAYKNKLYWQDFDIQAIHYKSQWCDKWNVMWFDGMRFDETARTSKYRLGKDTVIGDYTYSKFISGTYVRFTDDRKVYVYHEYFDDHDPYSEDLPTGEYLAYDFSAQVGDTLEVFSGVGTYSTYPCVVDDVQIDSETNLRTMTLHKICRIDEEDYDDSEMTWIEGVGSPQGFLISYLPCGWAGGGTYALLCAYQGDELKYTGSLYERFGCDYKAGVVSDDLFPTLSGLQRTICREYCEQADNKTRIEQFTNLTTRTETGGPYLYYSPFLLREKDNKILIYSRTLNKDLVLYDFNLQVGDSLPMLYIDFFAKDDWITDRDMEIWCVVDYHKDLEGNILPADTLIVTDVSTITLLDGKEYKKWTFNNGMEYVEGIGSFGNRQWSGDFFQLIANRDVPTSLHGEHLVCVSKNNKLLYQMDDAEMERLGAECLCEYTAELTPEDLFPTLWGLQRTDVELHTTGDNELYRSTFNEYIHFVPSKKQRIYLTYDSQTYLREENNQVLLYAPSYGINEDIVLYDWTLEKSDTLQVGLYDEIERGKLFRVTDVSTVTLLDGKEYKKWTLACGIEYIEGIGAINGEGFGNYLCLQHKGHPATYIGSPLVCASRNGQLLYQMDDTEMERLGAECLCEYNDGPKKDNAKDGKIGGRPTPTQWNMLEVETKEMDGTPTILRAETFSYTLENDSIVTKGKTFYQLARQSTKDTAITKSFVGALHFGEDEDNRVYFLRDGVEYVLYDFTAEPGDTIEIFAGINNYPQETTYTHVVTGKDTLENGACRMMLEVVLPEETASIENAQKVWLAGLGSIDGIVHNAATRATKARSSETQTSVMLCAWRDDNCLYTTNHPEYDTFGCVYNQDPTAVEDVETLGTQYQKILRDGHLYILRDDKIYDVLGTPMN